MTLAPATNKRTGSITMHVHGTPADPGRTLDMEGDSISVCDATGGVVCTGSYTYAAQYAGENNYARERSYAVSGSGLASIEGRLTGLIAAKPTTGPWVVSVLIGANDLNNTQDMTAWINRVKSYAASIRTAGGKVVLSTVLMNRAGTGTNITTMSSQRATYNTAVRAMLTAGEIEAIADYAADPIMGGDTSFIDYSGYWADATHPNALGHTRLKVIYAQAVSRAFQK
ncbi:MAG: SGNH/GDSL hydrolase family protein [Sandarakinorhabdus sp.]|nr:SGNH/GDSL hydrolase family protein [Sandarakinorhabdus sp.]